MARITVGNAVVSGFVNLVADNRLVIGTGSYQNSNNERVFKESLTVFLHEKFDGEIPVKGDYVTVSGDLVVAPRKGAEDVLNATFNVRFANQLVKTEAPTRAKAPASTADDDDI